MPRKRLVAPEFFTHEALCQHDASTRLAYVGLWTQADRRGIFRWRPNTLKLAILPYDAVDFAAIMESLVTSGFLIRYEVDGESYGIIPSFNRWQTFHMREIQSDSPNPPSTVLARCKHGASTTVAVAVAVAVTVPVTDAVAVAVLSAKNGAGEMPPALKGAALADPDEIKALQADFAAKFGGPPLRSSGGSA